MSEIVMRDSIFDYIEDEQELQYFHLYQDQATEINGPFTSEFWTRLVVQASQQDESIRNAVVALGALQKSRQSTPTSSPPPYSAPLHDTHYEFALNTYQKAITGLRERLAIGNASPKVALITCLLFVCFEIIHGDLEAALAQVFSGVCLLQEWKGGSFDHLSENEMFGDLGSSVEEQLEQMFAQLDIQARSFMQYSWEQSIDVIA
jgi:hypothetical protein